MGSSNPIVAAAQAAAAQVAANAVLALPGSSSSSMLVSSSVISAAQEKAAAFASALNLRNKSLVTPPSEQEAHYSTQLEINDFPQHARWKVTHKDALNQISEFTGAAITTRGHYYPLNKVPRDGSEPKLHLLIEGPSESSVRRAKQEVKQILETTLASMTQLPGHRGGATRYNIT